MKKNYSELLKDYLDKNVKQADEGFALLWQIEGFLSAHEREEAERTKGLEKQVDDATEFIKMCFKEAVSIEFIYNYKVMPIEEKFNNTFKIALAIAEAVKNEKFIGSLKDKMDFSVFPPVPFPVPAVPGITPICDKGEAFDDLPDYKPNDIVDIMKLYDKIWLLQKNAVHPIDRIFIYDKAQELEALRMEKIKVIRYVSVDKPKGFEVITESDLRYATASKALLIG